MDIPEMMKGPSTQKTASGQSILEERFDFLLHDIIDQLDEAERDYDGSLTLCGRSQCQLILVNFLVKATALTPSAESASD